MANKRHALISNISMTDVFYIHHNEAPSIAIYYYIVTQVSSPTLSPSLSLSLSLSF